jgi:hypothetical protein
MSTLFFIVLIFCRIAADQEQDRRQACLPKGLSAAFAGCEAQRAEQPADDHPQRLSRERSVLDNK